MRRDFVFVRFHLLAFHFNQFRTCRTQPHSISRQTVKWVSVSRKQSQQARSKGNLVWLVIKIVIGQKERVLLQWSLTLDVIMIALIREGTPCQFGLLLERTMFFCFFYLQLSNADFVSAINVFKNLIVSSLLNVDLTYKKLNYFMECQKFLIYWGTSKKSEAKSFLQLASLIRDLTVSQESIKVVKIIAAHSTFLLEGNSILICFFACEHSISFPIYLIAWGDSCV